MRGNIHYQIKLRMEHASTHASSTVYESNKTDHQWRATVLKPFIAGSNGRTRGQR
jgi:hypothetical protein